MIFSLFSRRIIFGYLEKVKISKRLIAKLLKIYY